MPGHLPKYRYGDSIQSYTSVLRTPAYLTRHDKERLSIASRLSESGTGFQPIESVQLKNESWKSPRPEGPKALSIGRQPQVMNKTWNRSHGVATATVEIAVATPWLERPGAFLTVGSRPQLSAFATSWLFFLPQCMLPKLDAL